MNDNKDGLKVKWAKSERTFRRLDAESLGERMVESWCGPRRHLVSPIPPIFWRQWSRRSKKGRKVQIKTRPRSNKFSAARDEPSGCVRAPLRFAGERSCNWTRGGAEAGAGSTLVCHNATDSRMSLWKFMFSFDVWRPLIISISSDQSSHATEKWRTASLHEFLSPVSISHHTTDTRQEKCPKFGLLFGRENNISIPCEWPWSCL